MFLAASLKDIWCQSHGNWKKWIFTDFREKIIFSDIFFRFFFYKFEKLYIDESWKKIQILLVKIKGISDARHQKRQKCEKIKQKGEHFSNTLPEWFSHISYFSYVANVSYNQRKIWYVQKNCNLVQYQEKCSPFSCLKTIKMQFYSHLPSFFTKNTNVFWYALYRTQKIYWKGF